MTTAPLISEPPLLRLVTHASSAPLTIPPAPRLAIVSRSQPVLDSGAVHRWVLKIRDLRAGDALVLPEYKVCCVTSPAYHLQYTVIGLRVLFHVDAQNGERQAWRSVAEWLVRDGVSVDDVLSRCVQDADAQRLSGVTLWEPEITLVKRPVDETPPRDVPVIAFAPVGEQMRLIEE